MQEEEPKTEEPKDEEAPKAEEGGGGEEGDKKDDEGDDKKGSRSRSRSKSRSKSRSRSRSKSRSRSRDRAPPARRDDDDAPRDESKVFVGNLSFDTREGDIRDDFSKFGTIKDVYLPTDRVREYTYAF